MTKKARILLLDSYRGFIIIHMVLFHFLYDVYMVFGLNTGWYRSHATHLWQRFICFSFIILSGMVWRNGKQKSLRRGLWLNLCGIIISLAVFIFLPSEAIWFGILNLLGCCTLLTYLMDRLFTRIPATAGMLVSLCLFFFTENIKIPSSSFGHLLLVPLGFPPSSFSSSDYFPLLPWYFLYSFGYFLSIILEKKSFFARFGNLHYAPLNWIGRKSLWIYMLHQPICYSLCYCIFSFLR